MDVEKIKQLIAKWREEDEKSSDDYYYHGDIGKCADELEELLNKQPEPDDAR